MPISKIKGYSSDIPLGVRFNNLCYTQNPAMLTREVAYFVQRYIEVFLNTDSEGVEQFSCLLNALIKNKSVAPKKRGPYISEMTQDSAIVDKLETALPKAVEIYDRFYDPRGINLFSLLSLLDRRKTSSLVHHVIQLMDNNTSTEDIAGVDFGSGSGILTVASLAAATRNNTRAVILGIEQRDLLIDRANTAFENLKHEGLTSYSGNIKYIEADITNKETYVKLVQNTEALGLPIKLWVSETFGVQTRPFSIQDKNVEFDSSPRGQSLYTEGKLQELEKIADPLEWVFKLSNSHIADFSKRMQSGDIASFPNFFDGSFIANTKTKGLRLNGSPISELHNLGQEYTGLFPDNCNTRWPAPTKPKKDRRRSLRRR